MFHTQRLLGIVFVLIGTILFSIVSSLIVPNSWWISFIVVISSVVGWKFNSVGFDMIFGKYTDEQQ